jgi:hypothetical protein
MVEQPYVGVDRHQCATQTPPRRTLTASAVASTCGKALWLHLLRPYPPEAPRVRALMEYDLDIVFSTHKCFAIQTRANWCADPFDTVKARLQVVGAAAAAHAAAANPSYSSTYRTLHSVRSAVIGTVYSVAGH